jgi:glucosylceramidase
MMKDINNYLFRSVTLFALLISLLSCTKKTSNKDINPPPIINEPETPLPTDVAFWLTNPDQSILFKKQNVSLLFTNSSTTANPTIEIDPSVTYQGIDGFGYTLTGGSASLMNSLSENVKTSLINELFKTDSTNIGVSYLRLSIGASDLSEAPFTYNDRPAGETDVNLQFFNIDKERKDLIPILKRILAVNPDIKILGSPWSPPTWMKSNNSFVGGSLKPEYYSVYAQYFIKYIQAMKAEGIRIDAITIQNEPLHPGNNPSLLMLAAEQAAFIKNHLGPAFEAANIDTKIILYDHNADKPEYPISILDDPDAKKYVDGSAFHLYGGNISALTQVHNAHPDKNLYFTEQWVGGPGNFAGDLKWHIETLIIGATRNWSRNVLEWNLAADQNYKPHTDGGCTSCLGAITINSGNVTRNVAYYIIAHASKFVRPDAVRISSTMVANFPNVAFKTTDGKTVLIVINTSSSQGSFNIKFAGKTVSSSLNSGAVGTYIW